MVSGDQTDQRGGGVDMRRVLAGAWPIMLGYLVIGIPCGILGSQAGMAPWMCLLLSATYFSGAGQFMLPNLWMAATPLPAIIASIGFVNTRQLLYAASFAPTFAQAELPITLAFSATVTDESFGVNTELFESDPTWSYKEATCLNLCCMSAWALANFIGAAAGAVVNLPTELASFAMTSIFICLLVTQSFDMPVITCVSVSMLSVYLAKLAGLESIAILVGALAGILVGLIAKRGGDLCSR